MTKTGLRSAIFLIMAALASSAAPAFAEGAPQQQGAEKITGQGVIKAIDREDRQLRIAHEAIPALKWEAMTMAFKVGAGVDLQALEPGAKVTFTMTKSPQGGYVIDQIKPVK